MSGCLQGIKTLFQRLPSVRDVDRADLCELVKPRDSSFNDFSNSDSLVDGTAHAFERDCLVALFLQVRQQAQSQLAYPSKKWVAATHGGMLLAASS